MVHHIGLYKLKPGVTPEETEAYRPKVAAIADAQASGRLAAGDDPVDLMMLVIGLVASWFTNSPALHALSGDDSTEQQRLADHRAALVRVVERLAAI